MTAQSDSRKKELGLIHAAKARLGLDDELYRDTLESLTGKRSTADMTATERAAVMQALGVKTQYKKWHKPRVSLPDDRIKMVRKIYAMLGDRPLEYVEAMLKQMFGDNAPDRLELATPAQLHKVVAALVYDQKRNGQGGKRK